MFKNYLKVAFRSLVRQKGFSLLNILGLATGIAACLLLIVHVQYQYSYESGNPEANKVYRVAQQWAYDESRYSGATPALMVKTLIADYPEVVDGARVTDPFDYTVKIKGEWVTVPNIMSTDSTFFNLFPNQFFAGDPETALTEPYQVVLTKTLADNLFGDEQAVGQIIEDNDGDKYTVSAVVADVVENTTVPYGALLSFPRETWITRGWWTGNNVYSYVKIPEGSNIKALESKMPAFIERYIAPESLEFMSAYKTWEEYLADGNYRSLRFIPIKDVHLEHPRLDLGKPGSLANVLIFTIVAGFILVIACINYINMSTAKSLQRAKEVGLRKVMGSVQKNIAQQFLVESLLITSVALVLGLALCIAALPFFNYLVDTSYGWSELLTLQNLGWVVLILVVVALLAGSYPALYISSFAPIKAMKGESQQTSSVKLRLVLVVFQFMVSTFLVAGTIIVFKQINYMNERNLGIEPEQLLIIKQSKQLGDKYEPFRNTLLQNSNIENIGVMSSYPSYWIADWGYSSTGDNPKSVSADHLFVDQHAMRTLELEVVEGNIFQGIASDTGAVVVNESFVHHMEWFDGGVGQILDRGGMEKYRVIGVVKDFVFRSGKRKVRPMLFRYTDDLTVSGFGGAYTVLKVTGDYQNVLNQVESEWNRFTSDYPFEAIFLDDSFARLYDREERFGKLFTTFSGLAIVIALVGLFALAAFTLQRRMKEMAVRKVLGASVEKLVVMIIWSFLKLVLIGSVLAVPVAYFLGNKWLENFHYRITIDPFMFMIPVVLVSLVAIITVASRSYFSATNNPVKGLRQE